MLQFREPELSDRPAAETLFFSLPYRLAEFNFSDLFIWRRSLEIRIAFDGGFLLTRLRWEGRTCFYFPAGRGDLGEAVRALAREAEREGCPLRLSAVTPEMAGALGSLFPGKFRFEPARGSFDYLYRAQDLITLAGRKYHSKRNHISRFGMFGDWAYEPVTDENFADVVGLNDLWCRENGCGADAGMRSEFCAVREALRNFGPLGLDGGLIRQNGRAVAFSLGQKLCGDTYLVQVEKALSDAEGAYSVINREFSARNCGGYAYINREDDAGVEGLRKAKLSYQPALLLEKNIAVLKEGETL